MRSKKADFKKKQIANWNKQASPRVRPVQDQIKLQEREKKEAKARENIEFRRNFGRDRQALIEAGIIKPGEGFKGVFRQPALNESEKES